jgi:frataxin
MLTSASGADFSVPRVSKVLRSYDRGFRDKLGQAPIRTINSSPSTLPPCLLFLYAGFMLDEKDFQRKADAAFEELKKRLLTLGDAHGFDVEGESGKLEVIFEEPEEMKFVISPNTPVREIWISALSTSFKLGWSEAKSAFVLEKTGEDIFAVMSRVVSQQLGEQVTV